MSGVLYSAPGSGLGHLNRALAVCLELRAMGVEVRIATNSPFAEGMARAAKFPVVGIAGRRWREDVRALAREARPDVIVCDTFPGGMRGEWEEGLPARGVYLARRLNSEGVRALAAGGRWQKGMRQVVALETLSADHEAALGESGVAVRRLSGPVRLKPGRVATAAPRELMEKLEGGRTTLVVHGGPVAEVERLVELAGRGGEVAVIAPWAMPGLGVPVFEYYPAGNVLELAVRVVSGAGYNMMADMVERPERHVPVAFERRWDDQAGRLAAGCQERGDGAREAAEAIREMVA
ncbi:MAG: hypothetical protein HY821_22335 [Acidobacteria bacterium]|nr:hypothetical protein [Acidobacteriota bacterium]